jgi:L-iditol 2-dehydrogenase
MKAALQTGREQIEVVDWEEPVSSDDTAIVKTIAAGICGSDLHPYFGKSDRQSLPEGHEVAGHVLHLPRDYAGPIKEGDLVAVDTICLGCACGTCDLCLAGYPFHCPERRAFRRGGAFAEALERKTAGLFKLPPGVTAEQGALVEPLAVGVHAVRWAKLQPGASVLIIGAGTIGLMTLIAARALGAGPIHVLARHPHQAALAEQLGATTVILNQSAVAPSSPPQPGAASASATAPLAATASATAPLASTAPPSPPSSRFLIPGGAGVSPESLADVLHQRNGALPDYTFETVGGHGPTLDLAWHATRVQGTVVVLGIFPDRVPTDLLRPVIRELWATFPICYGTIDGQHDFQVAIDLIAAGKAPVEKLVTHRYPLTEAPEAFRTAADKSTGSVKVQLFP